VQEICVFPKKSGLSEESHLTYIHWVPEVFGARGGSVGGGTGLQAGTIPDDVIKIFL